MTPRLLLLALLLATTCQAEMPNAPKPAVEESQENIQTASGQNVTLGSDGKLHLARWSVSVFATHDKKGWGPSSRVDYRINNRWSLVATEEKSTVAGGFSVRIGSLK